MPIRLDGIDHVALRVRDVERSRAWYEEVLGLQRRHPIWDVPVMVGVGDTLVALFPARDGADEPPRGSVAMAHLAFRTDRPGFVEAQRALDGHGIAWEFEDHDIAHSIYFADPDGHRLEITTYEP